MFHFKKLVLAFAFGFLGSISMAQAEMGYQYPMCEGLTFFNMVKLHIDDGAILSGQAEITVSFGTSRAGYWNEMPLLVDGEYALNYGKMGSRTKLNTRNYANGEHLLTMIAVIGPGDGTKCEIHDNAVVQFQN